MHTSTATVTESQQVLVYRIRSVDVYGNTRFYRPKLSNGWCARSHSSMPRAGGKMYTTWLATTHSKIRNVIAPQSPPQGFILRIPLYFFVVVALPPTIYSCLGFGLTVANTKSVANETEVKYGWSIFRLMRRHRTDITWYSNNWNNCIFFEWLIFTHDKYVYKENRTTW